MTDLFLSDRGRHTSFTGDWSSDVCSSDLRRGRGAAAGDEARVGYVVRGLGVLRAPLRAPRRRVVRGRFVRPVTVGARPAGRVWLVCGVLCVVCVVAARGIDNKQVASE